VRDAIAIRGDEVSDTYFLRARGVRVPKQCLTPGPSYEFALRGEKVSDTLRVSRDFRLQRSRCHTPGQRFEPTCRYLVLLVLVSDTRVPAAIRQRSTRCLTPFRA
jgi:hypothetical protein